MRYYYKPLCRLESLEIALLKESDTSKDETLNINNETLHGFSKEMNLLRLNLGNLEPSKVKHIHHFHNLVWVTVSLFIIALLLAYGWIICHNEKNVFEANDIKYRYWKADNNASLLKLTYYTDSLYDLDKGDFTNYVVQAEQEIAEQKLLYRLAGEKEKQRENLKNAKKSSSK